MKIVIAYDELEGAVYELKRYIDAEFNVDASLLRATAPGLPEMDAAVIFLEQAIEGPLTPELESLVERFKEKLTSDRLRVVCSFKGDSIPEINGVRTLGTPWPRQEIREMVSLAGPSVRTTLINDFSPFAYFSLADNLDDATGNSIEVTPVVHEKTELGFTDYGVVFPGSFSFRVQNSHLPCGTTPRTFLSWVYFLALPQVTVPSGRTTFLPQFVFSYGAERHGEAFGLYHGVPFFTAAMMRYAGLRVFFWTSPTSRPDDGSGDTAPFAGTPSGEWVHLAVSFNDGVSTAYLNGSLVQTVNRNHSTAETDVLSIGGFLPGRENEYAGYSLRGYIREFAAFDSKLSSSQIRHLYRTTAPLVQDAAE